MAAEVHPRLSQLRHEARQILARLIAPILLLFSVPALRADFAPRPYRVDNFGEDLGAITVRATPSPEGSWVVFSTQGIVWQTDGSWRLVPPPAGVRFNWAVSHPRGLFAASRDACWLYDGQSWHSLNFADRFVKALRFGADVIIEAEHGLYRVNRVGELSRLEEFGRDERNVANLQKFGDRLVLERPAAGRLSVWDGSSLREEPIPADLAGMPVDRRILIEDADRDGDYYFDGRAIAPQSFYARPLAAEFAGIVAHWAEIKPQVLPGTAVRQGDLVWFKTAAGIAAWSASTGEFRWEMPKAQFGGKINVLMPSPNGLLVGTNQGLQLVPDPRYYVVNPLPPGQLNSVFPLARKNVLRTSAGNFYLDGRTTDLPDRPYRGLAEAADGSVIWVEGTTLHWRGRTLILPWPDSTNTYPMELTPDLLGFLDRTGCRLVDALGKTVEVPLPGNPSALSMQYDTSNLLVSTTKGVAVIDHTGTIVDRFGTGGTTLLDAGNATFAADRTGRIFDDHGRELIQLPFTDTIATATWRNRFYFLGRLAAGAGNAVLEVDLAAKAWRPLDIPVPTGPVTMVAEEDHLLIIGEKEIARIATPRYLPPPDASVRVTDSRRLPLPATGLPAGASEVILEFPAPRLKPWSSPSYRLKIGDEPWQSVAAGTVFTLSRLDWGTTRIQVVADQLGLSTAAAFAVDHIRPWWFDWPGGLLYLTLLGALVFGLVRWRTAVLTARTLRLEQTVATRTEELSRANAVKSEFILAMNHEVRNPINGIVGLSQMLSERTAGPRDRLLLDSLQACTAQLRATLDDVFDFSAMERGHLVPVIDDFDLTALVRSACAPTAASAGPITLGQLPSGRCWCRGDAGKIRLALGNFISNAQKYGVPPGAEVEATVQTHAGSAHLEATLSVHSPGPALAAEELERLFQPFVRGSRARETRARGTGLGLVMCRRYATTMGGEVGARSADGRNTFWLRVPLTAIPAPDSRAPWIEGTRVLVVEDEYYNRLVLGHYLGGMRCVVDWAASATEAEALVARSAYQVIITDCSLPDATGAAVIHRIRAAAGDAVPPIIVVSASATTQMREEVSRAGARHFLGKPVDAARIHAALADLKLSPSDPAPAANGAETALDVDRLDFSRLLLLGAAERVLPGYASDLAAGLAEARGRFELDRRRAGASLHKLRNALLLVRADNAASLLAIVENLVGSQTEGTELDSLWAEAQREVEGVIAAVRETAGSQQH